MSARTKQLPSSERGDAGDRALEIARELYALAPDEFTAARNARAKLAGDKDMAGKIRALTKPSSAAWAINMLVLHRRSEIDALADLGGALREATEELDPAALRALGTQRRQLVGSLARQALALASDLGHPVAASAASDIEQTLQTALSNPDAAALLLGGQLTRILTQDDFEPAVARTSTARKRRSAGTDAATERDRKEADRARAAAEEAAHHLQQAETALARILDRREPVARDIGSLRDQLDAREREAASIEREIAPLRHDRDLARRAAEKAKRAAKS